MGGVGLGAEKYSNFGRTYAQPPFIRPSVLAALGKKS